ncbi:dnaJ [Symbiodinium necroappetens]|uniref:DnaJ protein n=1 Tax=Symbiodinium necroappetens TaxID=1628268 RepID=A0A812XCV4_9DINO|nr:dnaJ [Symbiodinium necroappetens]
MAQPSAGDESQTGADIAPTDGAPSSATYGGARSSSTYTRSGYPAEAGPTSAAAKPLTLRAAVKACDVNSVRHALLKLQGLNTEATEAALDATDGMGRTVLHICAANALRGGTGDVVKLLLEHKARTDARDANEKNPLDVAVATAAMATDAATAEDFLSAKATVSSLLKARASASGEQRDSLETSLGRAATAQVENGLAQILSLLTPPQEDGGILAEKLMQAVDRHDPETDQIFARIRQRSDSSMLLAQCMQAFDADGNTLLHRFVVGPNIDAAKDMDILHLLLESASDINNRNLLGETPLLAGARSAARLEMLEALIAASADPGSPDAISHETALMEAACRGDAGLCRLILNGRADAAARNIHGCTAWDLAIENRHSDVVQLLAENGSVQPPSLNSEVMAAVKAADVDTLQRLLSSLGTLELERVLTRGVDDAGRQLLHVSAAQGAQEGAADVVRLLLEFGAPTDDVDFAGDTPLSLAVLTASASDCDDGGSWAALDTCRVLLVAGASADAGGQLSAPNCALAEAFQSGRGHDVCQLLHAFGANMPWYAVAEASNESADADAEYADVGHGTFEAQCEQEGIPLEKLGTLGAKAVLAACSAWRQMTVKQLRSECSDVGIPTDGCVEKAEIFSRLHQVRIWQSSSLEMLREEVGSLGQDAQRSRQELEEVLLVATFNARPRRDRIWEMCKARHVPVDKFNDLDKAEMVLQQVQRLERGSVGDLKREFARRGLTVEAGTEKQEMISKLRDVLAWEEMPLSGLQQTCRERGLGGPVAASREELLKRLLTSIGQTKAAESRFKNFFTYGNPQTQETPKPGPSASGPQPSPGNRGFGDDFERAWEAKAEENRRAFASGNRNHAGMPSGQRRYAGPGPGFPGSGKQRSAAPQTPPIERFFRVLGLPVTASHDEVRKAYRQLALQYHPDKNPGQKKAAAEAKFREVAEAYDKVCEFLRQKK